MRNEDRERAIVEIVSRVIDRWMGEASRPGGTPVVQAINDTMYHEKKRLKEAPAGRIKSEDQTFWREIQRTLPRASEREQKRMLTDVVTRFAREVAGNFNPNVYQASVKVLPIGLSLLLNAISPGKLLRDLPNLPSLENNIHISGHTELLQRLEQLGTVLLLPTHLSNLDSPIVGWSIYKMGLPPFTYGAGLNLFTNPLLSFFMHNLGAYRVDRRKKASLYKEVLKEYATCSLEFGYNGIFFPGGTRSRAGTIERKIKKGLLGTSLRSYINNLQRGKENPNVYIVPCTINYHLVLEAETLIEDHLKEAGRSRYIIENDESSDIRKILRFVTSLIRLDSQIHFVVGEAFDPFGNRVDMDGKSYDRRGRDRPIDITRYVTRGGEAVFDDQRDHEYTNELGKQVSRQFEKYNMIMVTHLVAHACFSLLREKNAHMDLYRLLHTGGNIDHLPLREVQQRADALYQRLRQMENQGELLIEPWLHTHDSEEIVARALRFFESYHNSAVLQRRGDRVIPGDMNLLYYYQNRLKGYPLEASAQDKADLRAVA